MELPEVEQRISQIRIRHIQEMGGLFALFLSEHPEIDPNYADSMTDQQESEWLAYKQSSDLYETQRMELAELKLESAGE